MRRFVGDEMKKLFFLLPLIVGVSSSAANESKCDAQTSIGSWCRIDLMLLRPTQPAVGMIQVMQDIEHLKKYTPKKLEKYVRKKVIPVVVADFGTAEPAQFYLVDRHHLSSALTRLAVSEVSVRVVGRLDGRNPSEFWQKMTQNHWAWLKNQKGQAISPDSLPTRLSDLQDNPYRTLAGMLEDDGYFNKSTHQYFVEFVWGQWLGEQMHWQTIDKNNIDQALITAKKLACSAQASHLPGYGTSQCD